MSQLCGNCGNVVYRRLFDSDTKKHIGVDCGCVHERHQRNSCQDPFALTLEHVHDENGKPMRFENLRALSKWEAESGQQHAVLSYGENYMPSDWTPPTMAQLIRPREQRERGRFTDCNDGYRVIGGNGFTARQRRD